MKIPAAAVFRRKDAALGAAVPPILPQPSAIWPALAGVRFLLAFIVMSTHWNVLAPSSDPFLAAGNLFGGLPAVFGFLVISGYSIARSYDTGRRHFFIRRAARIYPVYLACIVGWWALFQLDGQLGLTTASGLTFRAPTFWDTVQNVFLLQGATTWATVGPAWSLSVECWFYLATPLLAMCRPAAIRAMTLGSMAAYFFVHKLFMTDVAGLQYGLAAFLLGWAWLAGFMLHRSRGHWLDTTILVVAGPVLLMWVASWQQPLSAVVYLGVCLVLLFGHRMRFGPRTTRVLNGLGELSYPLYLSHVPVIVLCSAYLGLRSTPLLVGAALLVAGCLVHAVDLPLRARLRRLDWPVDPVRTAQWLLGTIALCSMSALASFLQIPWFWLVGPLATTGAVIATKARRRDIRLGGYGGAAAGYALALFCACFAPWTIHRLGGPTQSSADFTEFSGRRFAYGVKDGWVAGQFATLYLAPPPGDHPLVLRIEAAVPDFLTGQIVRVTAARCALGEFSPPPAMTEVLLPVSADCLADVHAGIDLAMARSAVPPDRSDIRALSLNLAAAALLRDAPVQVAGSAPRDNGEDRAHALRALLAAKRFDR